MNVWEFDKLFLFLVFIIPGFISLKVYDLLVPSLKRDWAKSIVEIVAFSGLTYLFFSWLIYLALSNNWLESCPFCFFAAVILVTIIGPLLFPIVVKWILELTWIQNIVLSPMPKPWDYLFQKSKNFLIIITLKDDTKIGGFFGENSAASQFPNAEQIYLESVYSVDEEGNINFETDIGRGILIDAEEIKTIELMNLGKDKTYARSD